MVRNIGGYTRSYGSSPSSPEPERPSDAVAQPEASKPRKETASSSLAQREAEQNERLGKVVGAVVALALEGQSLPLDIAKSLLHRGTQAEVIRRAQASVVRMRESGIDVDLMEVGRVLSNLDETVVQQIRD